MSMQVDTERGRLTGARAFPSPPGGAAYPSCPLPGKTRRHVFPHVLGSKITDERLWVPTEQSLAMGIAVGLFAGLLPVPGIQTSVVVILSFALKAHLPTAAFASCVMNPLTLPAILVTQYLLGHWMFGLQLGNPGENWLLNALQVRHLLTFAAGGFVSALLVAFLGYPIARWAAGYATKTRI